MILTYDGVDYDIGCAQYPVKLNTEVTQVKEKSASGIIYRSDFAVYTNTVTYSFKNMAASDYQLLVDFFINVVNATMEQFTLTDDIGFIMVCNFAGTKLAFTKDSFELWNGSFVVEKTA